MSVTGNPFVDGCGTVVGVEGPAGASAGGTTDNAASLDQNIPINTLFVSVDFNETNEAQRLADALNNRSLHQIDPGAAYHFFTQRSTTALSDGGSNLGNFTTFKTVYSLGNRLPIGATIGNGGTFQFTALTLEYTVVGESSMTVVNGEASDNQIIDLGDIGTAEISTAVDALTSSIPIGGPGLLIKANQDEFYIYIGSEMSLGLGVNTSPNDYVPINPEEEATVINSSSYLVVRPFGNPFQLRKDPANDNPDNIGILETNDIILNGFNVDDTEFWEAAKYIGTDPANDINVPASYEVLGGGAEAVKTFKISIPVVNSQTATPFVELLPDPGVGKYIKVISYDYRHNLTSGTIGSNPVKLPIAYPISANPIAEGVLTTSSPPNNVLRVSDIFAVTIHENQPLIFAYLPDNNTGLDATVTVYLTYVIQDI